MKQPPRNTTMSAMDVLAGGGEMGERMRAFDWSQTPLGPVESWPQSLKTAVRIMLTSRQPIWLGWGEQLIKLYNDPYRAIVGGKHPAALGQPAAVVWREIWDAIGPMLQTATQGVEGTYVEEQLLIMERNGYPEETYYTFSYSPIPNDEGGVGGIICANTDDTQRVIGERQLALLRELAAKTADARTVAQACTLATACLAINRHDLPFALVYLAEPEARRARLVGAWPGVPRGHPVAPESVPLDAPGLWPIAEVLATGRPCLVADLRAFAQQLPAGAWDRAPLQAVALPLAAQGRAEPAGILVVGLNPYRLFDDGYSGFLELVAGQIAAGIANAQMYEDERRRAEALAELDRAKTAFFSNVSHEFRTPLTLMLGPLEDLLMQPGAALSPAQREQLEIAHRNALRLLKLVNTLLDFSRIEARRMEALYAPTDLATLTADLASAFRSAVERAGLRYTVDCPPLDEPVFVDREMWEKIVLNLLSNAFKFTFVGEIGVTLRRAGTAVELAVCDTGTGIPSEELPNLFARFHRVRGAHGRTFEGSGIGLAFVQELVRLHGGSVRVESELGRGSTFTVTIPLGEAHLPPDRIAPARPVGAGARSGTAYVEEALRWLSDASPSDEPPPSAVAAPAEGAEPGRVDKPRILLADDNADMRDYILRLLSQEYDVVAVSDGAAALRAARSAAFDLVLTDVMMPHLDGFGLLAALRADEQTRLLPVIMLSARAAEESRIEGMAAGADDYLVKPFSANELRARVGGHLEMARVRREAARLERELRAEAQAAKERLEALLASIRDQFLVLDRDWRYVFVNEPVLEMTGRSRDELLGRSIWEAFPEIVGTSLEQEMRRAALEQRPVHFAYWFAPWERWFENHIYPSEEGMTVFVADITERRHSEERLRESEERFRNMADNAPVMVWITEPDGTCSYLSKSWYAFTGQTSETGLGFGWVDAVHPGDREATKQVFVRATERQALFRIEYRLRRMDGTYRWMIDSAAPRLGSRGEFLGFIGSVIDITERKEAEEALRLSEDRLRLALKSADIGTWDLDPQTGALTWDVRCTQLFGLPPDMPVSYDTFLAGLHPDDRGRTDAALRRTFDPAGDGRFETEYRVIGLADGVERWIAANGQTFFDAAGRAVRCIGTVLDITERKRAEAERERQFAHERVLRAQAEEASRVKDEFLATVSHELRTPLTAFLGYAQLLRARKRDEAYIERTVTKMVQSAQTQAQIIEDLLDVSRIVSGKLRIELEPIDLTAVIRAALDTVRPTVEAKGLHLHTDLRPEASQIVGDPNRLQQVIWNLLSNAAKFTPPDGVIEVRLTRRGRDALLVVGDTGQGISPAFLPFVFERFRQADGTSHRVHGGLGLGLSIVRHLVEAHGGSVEAASDGAGQGATFTVQLPLAATDEPAELAAAAHRDGAPCPPELDGLRVLIVDDQPDILEMLHEVLSSCGALVQMCSGAREALETMRVWRPAVLVSDIAMPHEDGYWLIRNLRALPPEQGGATPAVALTAYVRVEERMRVLAAGFQLYVPKPVDPAEIQAVVAGLARSGD
ncbi:MAG TPA: ATP-binding protein [Roseiflexaceae bacterium]|nr:ATP-binding protein [Roseiflexaceae bacterium]